MMTPIAEVVVLSMFDGVAGQELGVTATADVLQMVKTP